MLVVPDDIRETLAQVIDYPVEMLIVLYDKLKLNLPGCKAAEDMEENIKELPKRRATDNMCADYRRLLEELPNYEGYRRKHPELFENGKMKVNANPSIIVF